MSQLLRAARAAALLLGTVATAHPAAATKAARVVFTGSVYNAGPALDGKPFTLTYIARPFTPGAIYTHGNLQSELAGGAQFGVPSPMSATFALNGELMVAHGDYFAGALLYDSPPGTVGELVNYGIDDGTISTDEIYKIGFADATVFSRSGIMLNGPSLWQPVDYEVQPGDTSYGTFAFRSLHFSSPHVIDKSYYSMDGQLNVSHLKIDQISVPEPSSWTLTIAGMGLAGGVLRRGRCRTRSIGRDGGKFTPARAD